MSKKQIPQISDEERALFREAVKGMQPLSSDNRVCFQNFPSSLKISPKQMEKAGYEKPPFIPQKTSLPVKLVDLHSYSSKVLPQQISGEFIGKEDETIQFARSGVQKSVLKKLTRRGFTIEAILDLHGFNLNTAHTALEQFLGSALDKNYRCVQIIHGKGMRSASLIPVLKNAAISWLRDSPDVLAFCFAKSYDGGTGAVYVLLKKSSFKSTI